MRAMTSESAVGREKRYSPACRGVALSAMRYQASASHAGETTRSSERRRKISVVGVPNGKKTTASLGDVGLRGCSTRKYR